MAHEPGNPGTGGSRGSGGGRSAPGGARRGGRRRGGQSGRTPMEPRTLLWKFKKAQTHFVEGQAPELRYSGEAEISQGEFNRRTTAQADQLKEFGEALALRKKIKPIKEPDANISESRKRAVRRKQKGRVGTLLTETLG